MKSYGPQRVVFRLYRFRFGFPFAEWTGWMPPHFRLLDREPLKPLRSKRIHQLPKFRHVR